MKSQLFLKKFDLTERNIKNLLQIFEFTKYQFDNEENLTKIMNLLKKAKYPFNERIQEIFESSLSDNEILSEILQKKGEPAIIIILIFY